MYNFGGGRRRVWVTYGRGQAGAGALDVHYRYVVFISLYQAHLGWAYAQLMSLHRT